MPSTPPIEKKRTTIYISPDVLEYLAVRRAKGAGSVSQQLEDGLTKACVANLHGLQTVPKENLGPVITTLSGERMREIETAISFALGFEELV